MIITEDDWIKGKQAHKNLSDDVANVYDQNYASLNFATSSYMDYELDVIDKAIKLIPEHNRNVALDLGCGTGRDAFHFLRKFTQVRGYDFSPEMIKVAEGKKIIKSTGNINFIIRDLEKDYLFDEKNSTINFINSGFGMGSFIYDLSPFLQEIRRVLEPRGIFIVSFYNRKSLVVQLENIEWIPALNARLDTETNFLKVNFEGNESLLAVRTYTLETIRNKLETYFEVVEITTYPTLSSLFPNSIFKSKEARNLCSIVDNVLRADESIAGGPYIIAVCRKQGSLPFATEPMGYENIIRLMRNNQIKPNVKPHRPVFTSDEVATTIGVDKSEIIKCVLVGLKIPKKANYNNLSEKGFRYVAVVLQANRFVDVAKLANILNVKRERITFSPVEDVEKITGFSVGSIPPFGFSKNINVFFDNRLKSLERVYCGTGKSTESLRISIDELIKLATPSFADISKDYLEK